MNGNSFSAIHSGTYIRPFTFSLFVPVKYHTLFCSCYNPLLIFFIITIHHLKLCEKATSERNDVADESSTRTELLTPREKVFTRFAPPTVSVVSRKVILLPSFRFASVLLFYVNLIMYSFQRGKDDGKKLWQEELLFPDRTFPSRFLFHQQNNNRNEILLSPTSPVNKQHFFFLLVFFGFY